MDATRILIPPSLLLLAAATLLCAEEPLIDALDLNAVARGRALRDVEAALAADTNSCVRYAAWGSDDRVGAEYDQLDALADGAKGFVAVRRVRHAYDETLAARTAWTAIGKGARSWIDEVDPDAGYLRDVAAVSNFLSRARRRIASKPVGIYYSHVVNTHQVRSYGSRVDCGPDNLFRVYELIRGNGYPVTFVTDRQILDAKSPRLNGLAALFMIDAPLVPSNVAARIEGWVRGGGALFADAQCAIYDENENPQYTLFPVFGTSPRERKKVADDAAEKLQFGYSCYAFDVINPAGLHQTQCETFSQPDGTHPILKSLGKAMISSFGCGNNVLTNGQVILINQEWGGHRTVGTSANAYGRGTACYFGAYLGGAYGSACSQYEWRDDHSEDSPYRLIDAFLRYVKAQPVATNALPRYLSYRLRFESPLVDDRGNSALPVENYSFRETGDFTAVWNMPSAARPPKRVFLLRAGGEALEETAFSYNAQSRRLEVAMKSFGPYAMAIALATDPDPSGFGLPLAELERGDAQ